MWDNSKILMKSRCMVPTYLLYPEVLLTLITSVVLSGVFCFLPLGNLLLCYLVGAQRSLLRCLHFLQRKWVLVTYSSVSPPFFIFRWKFFFTHCFCFYSSIFIFFFKKMMKFLFLGVAEYFKAIVCSMQSWRPYSLCVISSCSCLGLLSQFICLFPHCTCSIPAYFPLQFFLAVPFLTDK